MNFDKRHNVFNDIPGIDASKGERIVKALQRLWEKIERLEQIRNFERNSKSKDELSSSVDQDPSISDVRYKLLILQLQYVRSVLRKSGGGGRKTASRETQTGASLVHSPPSRDARVSEAATSNASKIGESKPHYHLKLDDVPFILGASSGASHSVVANVQNIIALMKTHNRALCGGSTTATREQHQQKQPEASGTLYNQLTRDLQQLATKQEELVKRLDAAQTSQKQVPDRRRKKAEYARCRSNSESSALPANQRKPPATSANQRKPSVTPANERAGRSIPVTNPPIAARRQFLRSLQNFKSLLTEEDISWD